MSLPKHFNTQMSVSERYIYSILNQSKGYDVMKYRKKPVVVEAYQTDKEVVIHTLEGDMTASVGDYIITGVNGEQYPCKPVNE